MSARGFVGVGVGVDVGEGKGKGFLDGGLDDGGMWFSGG